MLRACMGERSSMISMMRDVFMLCNFSKNTSKNSNRLPNEPFKSMLAGSPCQIALDEVGEVKQLALADNLLH